MKPQDILFFLSFAVLVYVRSPKVATIAGILCLIVAMPLFQLWIFFTAERLTWYGASFFLLAITLLFINNRKR